MPPQPDIFVSIASYRDPELIPTLKDMTDNASSPQHLHIAVCWQDEGDFSVFSDAGLTVSRQSETQDTLFFCYNGASVTVIYRHYLTSEGACWARHLSETCYQDEPYFLQIDSHCRFIEGWDQQMISLLESLKKISALPVLSAYPPGYQPGDDEQKSKQTSVSRMIFREFTREGIPMVGSHVLTAPRPVRGSYLAGGFIFAPGRFVRDVPNDPQIFFAGEEIGMSVRAFTQGYDVYHPHIPLLWHYYKRAECSKIWQDHNDDARKQGAVSRAWWERDRVSKQRLATLLGLNNDAQEIAPPYGHGDQRTLRQFEYQTGLHLRLKAVQPAVSGDEKQAFFAVPPASDAEWLEAFTLWHHRTITLSPAEITGPGPGAGYEFIRLSVYDRDNRLLFTCRQTPASLTSPDEQSAVSLSIRFSTLPCCYPHRIRTCGWQSGVGWGELTETPW